MQNIIHSETTLTFIPVQDIWLRIDCWKAEKDLKTTLGSDCALTSLAVDEPPEYARLYLDGNLQMWGRCGRFFRDINIKLR